jgi:adenylate cyclase
VQDELTQEIITALKIKLSAPEKARVSGVGTKNGDAYDLLMRGRELVIGNKRDRAMFVQANEYLRRAIELDPDYAALAWAYIIDY